MQALRGRRDSRAVESTLAQLKEGARGGTTASPTVNLMEPILAAAKAYVTMGEMCDAFREVWGVWRETPVF